MNRAQRRFTRYAWFVLALNVAVILWGAVVRATGAGAGCGDHWPLCNGQVIPPAPQLKTLIEYGHRVSSGLALICVIALVVAAYRVFPRGHLARRAAAFSLAFELTEALIGAGLVLLGHVAGNKSVQRGYSLGLHLSNTLLLLAALALTAWLSRPPSPPAPQKRSLRGALAFVACGIFLIGITGAITALGDTLFTASSLAEGLRQDFDASSHPFVRLRILHPVIAVTVGVYILGFVFYLSSLKIGPAARKLAVGLLLITGLQLCLGAVNLILMAPVPIQLLHLLLADLLWIAFVLLSSELLLPRA